MQVARYALHQHSSRRRLVAAAAAAAAVATDAAAAAAAAASAAASPLQPQQQQQQQQIDPLDARPHEGMAHPRLVFPHTGAFRGPKGRQLSTDDVLRLLSGQVSEQRLERLRAVVARRCYNVVPVVEGLHDVGNMSAVCRSADAMGLGAVHCVVAGGGKLKQSQRTTAGAEKWLDVRIHDDAAKCLGGLKAAGYQIVTTHLSEKSVPIQDVDWTRPTAFVLGNERDGVSKTAVEMADAVAVVPMAGFVESFNVSVAAALIMWEAQQQRVRRIGRHGDLSEREQEVLLAEFLIRGVREPNLLIQELISRGCLVYDRQTPVTGEAPPAPPASWRPAARASWGDWVERLEAGGGGSGGGSGGDGSGDAAALDRSGSGGSDMSTDTRG